MAPRYTAFDGTSLLARGALKTVISKTHTRMETDPSASILLFDDDSGRQTDIDFRGTVAEIVNRITSPDNPAQASNRGKGRPKLGVVSKEVTLLPRHWDWLRVQQGGASAALRRLVDEARRVQSSGDEVQGAQNATYAFISAIAGNLPGFEEVTRALFAKDQSRFDEEAAPWPEDIREHAQRLAQAVFVKRTPCLEA
jgi:hypothetical protein